MAKTKYSIPTDQNFWQLASIQAVSIGLAGILLGSELSTQYGAATTITSILIGNLIIWLVGLAIVAMSISGRMNAIENARQFLGKWGGIVSALVLLLAFVLWFALQLEYAVSAMDRSLREHGIDFHNLRIRIGSVLGIGIALVSLGGIQWIKRICTITLPILFIYLIYSAIVGKQQDFSFIDWRPSLLAVAATLGYNLSGIVTLPTFFRHARSIPHAFLALTLIFLLLSAIEIYSVWFRPGDLLNWQEYTVTAHSVHASLFLIMILLLLLCSNLVNIYFASSGWETLFPMKWTAKEYLIVGLAGTMLFSFIQDKKWTSVLENLLIGYLGSLGIILIASFLTTIVIKDHRTRYFEKVISGFCWGIGCAVVTFYQLQPSVLQGESLLTGMTATAISVLAFIFIEETCWSATKVFSEYQR